MASSFISWDQAEINMKELDCSSFDQIMGKGKDRWNQVLGRIEVEDDNIDNLRTFYSCLYRSLLFPRMFYEIDANGNIMHYSPYNGEVLPGYIFTDTGFWDTFRCLFPFLNLMYPSMNVKMQEGLVNAYKESGFLPEWASPGHRSSMVGNNSALVIADAYLKGLRGYDIETLYEGLLYGTEHVHPKVRSTGRFGHDHYNKSGYIPNDVRIGGNVARTLEYANADWGIYQLGKALNRPEEEINVFAKRAMNYRKLFDSETRMMRARTSAGEFSEPFNPVNWEYNYTEGNAWHYAFTAFHDPQGLIDLMGGYKAFNSMLDSMFAMPPHYDIGGRRNIIHEIREMQIMGMGQYAHGNQPIQHAIYLYNYSGEPWKAQYWAREVMDKLYSAAPDGYCGDEDNGQTSAWYVFSALGMYTVCPGTDQYILGSPLFKKVKLHLENGNKVVIKAPTNDPEKRYVNSLKVNGKPYQKNYLTHADLMKGIVMEYEMSDTPNTQRGTTKEAFPYSFSNENTAPFAEIKKTSDGRFELYLEGRPTYIKGVGGTFRLDIAAESGANAFRTWGGSIESIKRDLQKARLHNMYIMQGIGLTKDSSAYHDENYKSKLRNEVRELANVFKDDPNIFIWCLGNEIDLANANNETSWKFVEELAQIIKSIDKKHLVGTVIAHNAEALDYIAACCPSLDMIGINSYGSIGEVASIVKNSQYKGAYMITEWGPTGFWERNSTTWGAPLEQTSEEKRIVYEERYTQHIQASDRCLGSFVFLWGQKEERTPTWFSMFVERNVEGLPLKGEKTPMVEAMIRVWNGKEPAQTAPVVHDFTINGKKAEESITVTPNQSLDAKVTAIDKEKDKLTYVWEILEEATVLGFGGSYEPRPDRVGEVKVTEQENFTFKMDKPGNYRLYVYVLDNTGFVATVNIPFQVQ